MSHAQDEAQIAISFAQSIKQSMETDHAVPLPIGELILDLSGHTEIERLWMLMRCKLRQFSFAMAPGCSLQKIQKFERQQLNHEQLPWDMRLSLMYCDGIRIPYVFRDSTAFESAICPLKEFDSQRWPQYDEVWKFLLPDDWALDFYATMREDGEDLEDHITVPDHDNFGKVMRIGVYGVNVEVELHIRKSIDVYWHTESGKILVAAVWTCNWDGTRGGSFSEYSSFAEFFEACCYKGVEYKMDEVNEQPRLTFTLYDQEDFRKNFKPDNKEIKMTKEYILTVLFEWAAKKGAKVYLA